jgi:hypothetical protein
MASICEKDFTWLSAFGGVITIYIKKVTERKQTNTNDLMYWSKKGVLGFSDIT